MSKLVAACAMVMSNAPKKYEIKKRFMRVMKHRIGERCDVKDFWGPGVIYHHVEADYPLLPFGRRED
jgi:hypothetical protein